MFNVSCHFCELQHPYKKIVLSVRIRIHPVSEFGTWDLNSENLTFLIHFTWI